MTNKQVFPRYLTVLAVTLVGTWSLGAAPNNLRIIQTNSAGDNIHIIDPASNKVVGEIKGIEVSHGVAAAPDGTRIYISNESMNTLDVVDAKTLKVFKQVPLSVTPTMSRSLLMGGRSTSRSSRRPAPWT